LITGFQYPGTMDLVAIFTIGGKILSSMQDELKNLWLHVADSHILTSDIQYVIGKKLPAHGFLV